MDLNYTNTKDKHFFLLDATGIDSAKDISRQHFFLPDAAAIDEVEDGLRGGDPILETALAH